MIVRFRRAGAAVSALGVVLALTAACAFGPPDPDQQGAPPNLPTPSDGPSTNSASQGDQEVAVTVLAKGLEVPWGIAFLPDGAALVTERDSGRILQVGPDSDADGLKVTEVQRIAEAQSQETGDGGLLGIAVSPKYATDKTVFIYYTTATDNRVARLVLKGKPQPILTGIPRSNADNGGQLAFGPDGFLYATTGDSSNTGSQAQNPKSLAGKILRMTTAGKAAPGNPVKDSLVWSLGHRNVQGIAWDQNKKMYATENAQPKSGELNVITKGANYGWARADGNGSDPKLTNPLYSWPIADSFCAGVAVMGQSVATSCLLGKRVWLLNVTGNGTVLGTPQAVLTNEYGRLRGLVAAPDGSLWASTSNQEHAGTPAPDDDRIIRLVFSDGGAGRS